MSNPMAQHIVDDLLRSAILPLGPECDCPYLPGRKARNQGFIADQIDPQIYAALLDRGFRRSATMFYQPRCRDCRECRQTRVPVSSFTASRSQRRVWRHNQDLEVTVGAPQLTQEKWELYARYLRDQHDGAMSDTWEDLYQFLYHSPLNTIEFCYHLGHTLVGVSIADSAPQALSSVYMYFDPPYAARSLGTYSVLWEIDYCRRQSLPYYYLGFYVEDCSKMAYKGRFLPQQRLSPDFEWIDIVR